MRSKDTTAGPSLDQVRAAKRQALGAFKRLGKVNGVGITRVGEGYGLKINLEEAPAKEVTLPDAIQGIPVRVEVVGPIKKRAAA
ncbi:MAG: hypothetical protein QOH88_3362 [Verrucomicrobiota bacterium]|jgi:hypothetical protein